MHLARTLSVVITLADINVTLVCPTAGHVTVTWHTTREPVVADWTLVAAPASVAISTATLTSDDVTLAGRRPLRTALTRLHSAKRIGEKSAKMFSCRF